MKIELREWGVNTELILFDDDGTVYDRFYTADKPELPCNVESIEQFRLLEDKLSPPKIGGQFAEFHPYWTERKARRASRNDGAEPASQSEQAAT